MANDEELSNRPGISPQYQKGSNHIRRGTGDSFVVFTDILNNQAVQINSPKLHCEERSPLSQRSRRSHISSDGSHVLGTKINYLNV